jgi:hypothetical protein
LVGNCLAPYARVRSISPVVAAVLAIVLGSAEGSSQTVQVQPAAARFQTTLCGHDSGRFVVPTADGGARTMEICGGEDHHDPAGTARALSAAIDAAAEESRFYAHSRMPDLLGLRLARARTHVDESLPADEKQQRLAALDREIKSLESEIEKSISSR